MGLFNRLIAKVRGTSTASALDWNEIEVELLASDLGPTLVSELLNAAKKMRGDDAEAAVKEILLRSFHPNHVRFIAICLQT